MKISRTRGLTILASISAAFLVGCGSGGSDSDVATFTDTSSFQPQKPVSDWQLVWSDEFDGSSINSRKWTLEANCNDDTNTEKQCFTENAENAFIEDGVLNIVALPSSDDVASDYTSARLNTKNKGDFKYGRFEVRAQMPAGQGSWPEISMMPTDSVYGVWPNSGEIEIVEMDTVNVPSNHIHGTLHYDNGDVSSTGKAYAMTDGATPADGFHTYAVEWNEGEIRWYIDDYLYATQRKSDVVTNSKGQSVGLRHQGWFAEHYSSATGELETVYSNAPFDQEFFLALDLAVSDWALDDANASTYEDALANGQTFKIDYVRVYECSMNPETGKGCETVRAGYDMSESDHSTGALVTGSAPIPSPPAAATIENLTIFAGTTNENWAAWDCCGGTTPGADDDDNDKPDGLVADPDRGDVYQFTIGEAATVVGFSSRAAQLSDDATPSPFDASPMADSGSLSFDVKVITPPNDATSTFMMKIEATDATKFAELPLNASQEGVDPSGEWQTFTYALTDLQTAGLDISSIDVLLIFPAWGTGNGAVYQVDNIEITSPLAGSPSLEIFADEENASWPFWDCCGSTTPEVVTDEDSAYGAAVEFTVVGATVLGFNSRSEFTDTPAPFDASGLMADGVLQFDLKVITPTADPSTDWKMKIESNGAAEAVELSLTQSTEGAAPSDQWQSYTYNISDLVQAGLDASAIDVLMVFPAWGAGDGAVYRLDNVRIYDPTAVKEFKGDVLFKNGTLDAWPLWDCCGSSTPTVVADDIDHGAVAEFAVSGDTVLGFNSRSEFTDTPEPIDASAILTDGVLQFEMKVTTMTADPATDWKMKIESNGAAEAVELSLTQSQEGAAPALNVWQTYTYSLQELSTAGLDISAIDVVMVFPAWGAGDGAVYRLDNVMIYDPNSVPSRKGIALFENGQSDWALWDCCGGSTPTVEVDDSTHGTVVEFTVSGDTVLGFNTRGEFSDNPSPYDASALLADGYLRFEMKVLTMPADPATDWKMKIESNGAAEAVELSLSASQEGAAPALDGWQTYTYSLQDLSTAGLDISAIDVVMVFPAWGAGDGAVYRIDNVVISAP